MKIHLGTLGVERVKGNHCHVNHWASTAGLLQPQRCLCLIWRYCSWQTAALQIYWFQRAGASQSIIHSAELRTTSKDTDSTLLQYHVVCVHDEPVVTTTQGRKGQTSATASISREFRGERSPLHLCRSVVHDNTHRYGSRQPATTVHQSWQSLHDNMIM